MHLSTSFSMEPDAAWVRAHNAEATEVVEAFHNDKPIRVPVFCGEWAGQHGFYADEIGLDYRSYYNDPEVMLQTQLEAARRRREMPIYDLVLGEAPESWPVSVDLWPVVAPAWVGCEVLYRADSVIAHRGMHLSKEECRALEMPDPVTGPLVKKCGAFRETMRQLCKGLTFLGRPVGPVGHGVGTNGFFSLVLDIRGADILPDMYDDPDFAREFLLKIATWCDRLDSTWAEIDGNSPGAFQITDHGIDMLSPKLYEEFVVPVVKEMNRRRGTKPPTFLHHCGLGPHLFPVVKRHFGLTHLDSLTFPSLDIAKIRREIGEEVWINACIADEITRSGPPERIRQAVKDLMDSGAKGEGRLSLHVGDMLKGTPLEHRIAFYEAVREFGTY